MKQKTLLGVALACLLGAFILATLIYNIEPDADSAPLPPAQLAALQRAHAPSLGPAQAPVTIVEFLDPACETCAAFYPIVKQILTTDPQRLRLVVRYAPFHKGSDQVVAALEAARKQDKFWPALEALLASQREWVQHHVAQPERIWPILERAGLDLARLRADIAAPEIARVIEQDLLDAQLLQVSKTPDFFVNGRPLASFGEEPLRELVAETLRHAKR
jgi:protein-disulfide isomerase